MRIAFLTHAGFEIPILEYLGNVLGGFTLQMIAPEPWAWDLLNSRRSRGRLEPAGGAGILVGTGYRYDTVVISDACEHGSVTIAHRDPEAPTYSLPAWNTVGAGIAENDTRTSEISLFGVGGEGMWKYYFSALSWGNKKKMYDGPSWESRPQHPREILDYSRSNSSSCVHKGQKIEIPVW